MTWSQVQEAVYKVVKTVATPLRFFAVVIVVLAGMILVLATMSKLPADLTVLLIVIAFVAFMLLIVLVTLLVLFAPKKLLFDQEAHLAVMREKLGDSELPTLYVGGMLEPVEAMPVLPPETSR